MKTGVALHGGKMPAKKNKSKKNGTGPVDTIENMSRQQIASFLPDAIAKALTSYHEFAERNIVINQAKAFSEHHSACKVAVAHIELLIKLARWADLPHIEAGKPNEQVMLAAMMQEAEEELARIKREDELFDEENE
jgi:hypothetical protein